MGWGGGVTRGHISWGNEGREYHSGDPDQGCLAHNRGQEMYSDGSFLFLLEWGLSEVCITSGAGMSR